MMKLASVIPMLKSFDEAKAREFYIEFLEFKIDWEHRFEDGSPLYMQISKDQCVLHISEHFGDCTPGSAMRIEVDDLNAYQKLLIDKQYKNARPELIAEPWGQDMRINDPFGNTLIFSQLHEG